jgi:hypothetical protein
MSYISVVLVPVFKNQKNYWWVAIIILGLVALLYPFYASLCPSGLSDKDRIAVFTNTNNTSTAGKTYTIVSSSPDVEMIGLPNDSDVKVTPVASGNTV